MSKELEAFMKYCPIIPSENNFKYWSDYQIALKKYERELQTFTKTFELLKKALTPPTADEVCEAIQKELDYGTVEYVEGNREFMFVNHGEKQNITECYGDRYKVIGFYKSSTLSLIGRFYEGLGGKIK